VASVQQREGKSGTYFKVTISNGNDSRGKKITRSKNFNPDPKQTPKQQEKALQKFVYEFEEQVKRGNSSSQEERMFFEIFTHEYLEELKARVSNTTYESYKVHLDSKIIPFFKDYRLGTINTRLVEKFYGTMIYTHSNATIIKNKNILNGMFKKAVSWEWIEANPCTNATIPKSRKKQADKVKFFTHHQAICFLKSLDIVFEVTHRAHHRIDDTGKPYYVNDYIERKVVPFQLKVLYHIALCCGLRRNEMLALHWDDIDLDQKTIRVSKALESTQSGVEYKEPKTKSSIRTISIPDAIIPILKQYRNDYSKLKLSLGTAWRGHGNIFTQSDGNLMGVGTPNQHFKRHIKRFNEWVENNPDRAKAQGFETLPTISLHGLRHSCASILNHLNVNYGDISKVLGHSNISTTMRIYTHSFDECTKIASDKINELLIANV